jgi:hypothetical protein
MLVIYGHLNILAMFCYNLHPAHPEEDEQSLIAWFLSGFLSREFFIANVLQRQGSLVVRASD